MNRYVVVSGLPASGKSTVARALSGGLSLPLFDKDDFLESRFEASGIGDALWRRRLSREADGDLRKEAQGASGAVLTSWWKHPRSPVDSGTPTEWLASLPGTLVEVYCRCAPQIAAERFLARRRHPGHLDGRWTLAELLADFERQAALGPLGIGGLIVIPTESPVEAWDWIGARPEYRRLLS